MFTAVISIVFGFSFFVAGIYLLVDIIQWKDFTISEIGATALLLVLGTILLVCGVIEINEETKPEKQKVLLEQNIEGAISEYKKFLLEHPELMEE